MKHRLLVGLTILALASVPLSAQRGGGRGGGAGQGGAGSSQGGGIGIPRNDGPQTRGDRSQSQTQGHIHATDQQRDQIKTSNQSAERVRSAAKTLADAAKGSKANNADFVRARDQLKEQIQLMQQDHQRFVDGLDAGQKQALADRLRAMDREQETVNNRLREVDKEFAKQSPDRKRVEEHARAMEQSMKEWQKQYQETISQMSP